MKLTPLDIRHKEFRRGMRGYSDEDVDVFLDEVADEFERLLHENAEASERIEHLVEQIRHFESLRVTLQNTLLSAQRQADEVRSTADAEAELIIKDAEVKAAQLVSDTRTEQQRMRQNLSRLKAVEEDFRFKFRSLLEAHINLLAEDEASEERREFHGLVESVEAEVESRSGGEGSRVIRESTGSEISVSIDDDPFADIAREAARLSAETEVPVFDADARWAAAGDPAPEPTPPEPLVEDIEEDEETLSESPPGSFVEDTYEGDPQAGETGSRRRPLFGRRQKETPDTDFFDGPQDRDFHW